jgi:hypothetical protein
VPLSRPESTRGSALRRLAGFVAGIALCLTFGAAAAPLADAGSAIGTFRTCSSCVSTGGDLSRYDYVVLNAWDYGLIPALKAANPNVKVLVYKDLPSTSSNAVTNGIDNALLPAGVGYAYANANDPDWFLLDTSGQRIEWSDYPGNWQMDPGNSGYQDQWLSNVEAELQRNGWDGVMLDDTNTGENEAWHLGGRTMAKYPTASSYTAATRSFLARVCPALKAAGFIALPNIASTTTTIWSDWVSLCSGAVQEYWTKWGWSNTQQFTGSDWDSRQQFLPVTEQLNRIFLGITYAPMSDVRSMRYARASFLLDWDGGPSALAFEPTDPDAQNPYSPEWTVSIGKPLGPRYQVGTAWRRDYDGGTVLVNPSASVTQTVSLGANYLMPDGTTVSSVTLQPVTGLILTSTGAVSPPPPPPPPASPPPPPPPPASPPPPPAPPSCKKQKKKQACPGTTSSTTPTATTTLASPQRLLSASVTLAGHRIGIATLRFAPGLGVPPISVRLSHIGVALETATASGWKVLIRARTDAVGRFRIARRWRGLRLRVAADFAGRRAYSPVFSARPRSASTQA